MLDIDVSIIIVHTYEKNLIIQTLRSIRRSAPKINYEVIVVDNNPAEKMREVLKIEFPNTRYQSLYTNIGFGSAMNVGIRSARGRYILIFNPDIVIKPNSLEKMVEYMDKNNQIGILGPQLLNSDGSLQYSCYTIPTILMPAYRRTLIGKLPFAKRAIGNYLMLDYDHNNIMEVDSLIGAVLFTRRSALDKVGLFDEQFFMYYEDNDLCRRFWENGYKVVYYPEAKMIHYHRRASADGDFIQQLMSRFTWIQIASAIKFFKKYYGKKNPRK